MGLVPGSEKEDRKKFNSMQKRGIFQHEEKKKINKVQFKTDK